MSHHRSRFARFFTLFLFFVVTGVFVFGEPAAALFENNPAGGAGIGMPMMMTGSLVEMANNGYKNIVSQITRAGVVAFFNALQNFAGTLAYDAANYIASGGKGQDAVYYKKGFGNYLKDVASDAAGEFIGGLSDSDFFRKAGFDLCKPRDPRLMINLQVNLGNFFPGQQGQFSRPKPRCDYQEIVKNYSALYQTMSNEDAYKNASISLSTEQSDIGTMAQIFTTYQQQITSKIDGASKTRTEGQGYKDIQGYVSGYTKTPSQVVKETTNEQVIRKPGQTELAQTGAILTNAFKEGPIQLAVYTASVFLNTLTSKFMKRIFEKGLGPITFTAVNVNGVDTVVTAGKTDARSANIDLRTPNLQKVATFEVMAELIACPQPPTPRGLWNCTIDQPFAQAIQTQGDQGGFTIGEALAKDLLHKTWKLIPSDAAHVKDNQSLDCFLQNYCASNLQKLRLNRILPVGFEFAANSEANKERCASAQGCVTLQEVVDGFTDCNDKGELDREHPWCHLIDSNWVITSVPQQCLTSGYSETLLSNSIDQRKEECQDVQSCLKRNNKGQCVGGYGYCLADKTVYRFTADECPVQYASCRVYQNRAGEQVSYLRNTLDYAQCTADNVGCLWYATERNATSTEWIGTTSTGPRVYFDKTLVPCDAANEGCTKLHQMNVGQSALNLLLNSSFEKFAPNSTTLLADWKTDIELTVPKVQAGTPALDGAAAVPITLLGKKPTQHVPLVGSRTYTLSFFARSATDFPGDVTSRVTQYKDVDHKIQVTDQEMVKAFRGTGCAETVPVIVPAKNLTTDWKRFECTFVTSSSTRSGEIDFQGSGALLDAVELEEGEFATPYVDGLNTKLPVAHMKVAPPELSCTGANTDPALCKNFAATCRQADAGCQGYTDVAGGSEIPAILSTNDLCPAECVGYAEYRKGPSAFDLVQDVDKRFNDVADTGVAYFIPKTAQLCKQEEVGCEEFTNVESAGQGGEQVAQFSYVRACEKPDKNSETYFTWEGSDTAGFQLKTWSLKKGGQPLGKEKPGGPIILEKRGPNQAIFKEPATCDEKTWRTGVDPDCRQFYDAAGNVFYRYYSQTVLSSDSCINYRLNKGNAVDCKLTGGIFNPSSGECVYQVHVPESRTCSATAVGCRAYTGVGSGNIKPIFSESFRENKGAFTTGEKSTEALLVGDGSLKLSAANQVIKTELAVPKTSAAELYQLTFWIKSPALPGATMQVLAGGNVVGTLKIGADWQRFSVGPFAGAQNSATTTMTWSLPTQNNNAIAYLDEVSIQRIQDIAYVRRDTWTTPDICDRSSAGAPQPQAMLGCRAYKDRAKRTLNVKEFSRLCRGQSIGCVAFVDTRNSANGGPETFVMEDKPAIVGFGPATTVRPADRYLYLIDDPTKRCQAEQASCRAFGRPNFTPDRLALDKEKPFTTQYVKDDITKYDQALCKPSEIFCDAFVGIKSTEYFRNPDNHVCEYKTNVRIGATGYTGWFVKGSSTPCYPEYLESGSNYNIARSGDQQYRGWGGMCPEEQTECTEFRDTNDTSDPLHKTGKPYFFVQNDNLDVSSCTGGVDLSTGCILLRDMSASVLKYNVVASYEKYRANGFKPTSPLNCATTDRADKFCGPAGRVTNDANLLVKVDIDRDCAQWLGCKSSETVFDPATKKYKDVCTNLAICDKASGVAGDVFCANYVDRSLDKTLTQGAYFDIQQYANRKVGLGEKDYSGYSIPNAFQVPDLVSAKVGAEGALTVPDGGYKFALDYRLAAAVQINTKGNPGPNDAVALTNEQNKPYKDLFICRHVRTGMLGYYRYGDYDNALNGRGIAYCYLPVRGDSSAYNFPDLAQRFAGTRVDDPSLNKAFPPPTCRAYPEADSPYPATFVEEWDYSTNPPRPRSKADGFKNANTCEIGEDCSCTYKRADYPSIKKFYGLYSEAVPPGICMGGPRDGQSCLPETVFKIPPQTQPGANQNTAITAATAANATLTCGPPEGGGKCFAFSKLEIVRGIFGQCLEQDETRILGTDQNAHPCLTWNPTPILFGDKDPYHYIPTAGYMPPANSGQYYCLSQADPPSRRQLVSDDGYDDPKKGQNDFEGNCKKNTIPFDTENLCAKEDDGSVSYAGHMVKLSYNDAFVSTRDNAALVGSIAGSIFLGTASFGGAVIIDIGNSRGADLIEKDLRPDGSNAAAECRAAVGGQNDDGNARDTRGLRLVSTGRGIDKSYTETFLLLNKPESFPEVNSMSGQSMAYIKIAPIVNPNGKGRLGCGYQADWVEGLDKIDYGNEDNVAEKDKDWRDKFFENYNPTLTRATEDVLMDVSNKYAFAVPCTYDPTKRCFIKYWETDYRANGEESFLAFKDPGSSVYKKVNPPELDKPRAFQVLRQQPIAKKCEASQPYFAIRSVFETPTGFACNPKADPNSEACKSEGKINKFAALNRKWNLAGFWVSACAGQANDNRFIYMSVDIYTGSVCSRLAEVRSRDSYQDAAYTDRVWREGGFRVPGTGTQYGGRFAPFSSALNIGPAGADPLFQTGGATAGFSRLSKPSFLSAGADTYYRPDAMPKDKWAYLTNIFARIYRIYVYHQGVIGKTDNICAIGLNRGARCVPLSLDGESATSDNNALTYSATCEDVVEKRCIKGQKPNRCANYGGTYNANSNRCTNVSVAVCVANGRGDPGDPLPNPGCGSCKTANGCQCTCAPLPDQEAKESCTDFYKNPCLPVADNQGNPSKIPLGGNKGFFDCSIPYIDQDGDNNSCTHGSGYYPILCPNPKDEFCGLMSYNISDPASIDPNGIYPIPTDVTMGHYTPLRLGLKNFKPQDFNYISYYNPVPPRIASPRAKDCLAPGRCPVERMDAVSLNGQSEGVINIPGGQHKANLRFYAWAAHNQMPLRRLIIDWGDGQRQELPDARLKNHKPFCNVLKECVGEYSTKGGGLTCDVDADCPPGAGPCRPIGMCLKQQNIQCSQDTDCGTVNGQPDTCNTRLMFGNSKEACNQNYFEFQHLYTCTGSKSVPDECGASGRCSRDPNRTCQNDAGCAPGDSCVGNGLAPKDGCWSPAETACRFTPRILIEDNWGWCTGECRNDIAGNVLQDKNSKVRHEFGGCYSWSVIGNKDAKVKFNTNAGDPVNLDVKNECKDSYPGGVSTIRPWIVYPGSIQLRSTGQQ